MSGYGLLDLLQTPEEGIRRFYGVAPAIVTNNRDKEQLGRVRLHFPWLSDDNESGWARIAVPMAGKERGAYFLPEVDDEVLVAFEHGDPRLPYVVGALWNGQDKPPEANEDGKNDRRVIKSRSGHVIRLHDGDDAPRIEIVDKTGKNAVVIDAKENKIAIKADSDITIASSGGKLVLEGSGVEIRSQADVTVEASGGMKLSASGQLNVEGATVNIN